MGTTERLPSPYAYVTGHTAPLGLEVRVRDPCQWAAAGPRTRREQGWCDKGAFCFEHRAEAICPAPGVSL